MKKIIIFTDLDGTLLDHAAYSFAPALPALELLKKKNIPLVLCSSKTMKEIEFYRGKLRNPHPFISENGGGIFIPKDYFGFDVRDFLSSIEEDALTVINDENNNLEVIRLGARYEDLRRAIGSLREKGFRVTGFGDMTIEEISDLTGLSPTEAELARKRDFDEPFIFSGNENKRTDLLKSITTLGFNFTEGNFFHLLGNSDKGRAVTIVSALYRKKYGDILTVGLGDNPNDIPMLDRVDYPVIVRKPDGSYHERIQIPGVMKADGIGPAGWNSAVLKIISDFS